MDLELVKNLLELDFRADKRKGKRRKGRRRRGSSSSESSSDDDREGNRLEEQALQARQPEQPPPRRLGPGWMPQCQQQPLCLPTWNSIGSPMQEHQQQLRQWQFTGAALDQNGGLQNPGYQGICGICGVKGHKARDCVAKCPHCGRTGHAARDCFELEANAHRRPQGWKPERSNWWMHHCAGR